MNKHKDLPPGSQAWAGDVDKMAVEIAELKAVVRRLTENAGIDMSNPKRGVNTGDTPSVKNPVGQKLSSMADVHTYNVADGQVLTWEQKGQKWLPVTPLAGDMIPIPMSYAGLAEGYGEVDGTKYAYTAAAVKDGYGYAEIWGSDYVYIGAGDWDAATGLLGFMEVNKGKVILDAADMAGGPLSRLTVETWGIGLETPFVMLPRTTTGARPNPGAGARKGSMVYDTTINKPIWWNGTAWTDALGTLV